MKAKGAAIVVAMMCSGLYGQVRIVASSPAGDRLTDKGAAVFARDNAAGLPVLSVDASARFQRMDGFGATFTEAGQMVLKQLPSREQERVLEALFHPAEGAGFTLMKSPLAAFDFSTAGPWYSYAEVPGDMEMKHFSIARDLGPDGLITFIRRARRYGSFAIQSTTDFPPDWMLDAKKNVKPEYYPALARYFVEYLREYAKQGIHIDYLSPFNEPEHVYCKITHEQMREFFKQHLGPALVKSGLATKLQLGSGHFRSRAVKDFPKILDDPEARKYISVMPVHGYVWDEEGSALFSRLHEKYPDLPIWQSEVCYAKVIDKRPMPVWGFEDGDRWGRMLLADINNWVSGWIYWNMILDQNGGPWAISEEHGNAADNPQHPVVIIDTEKKQVHYTGVYYYLAHFSRYVRPGAVRIGSSGKLSGASFAAFENPDGARVLAVVNSGAEELRFALAENGRYANISVPARGIVTCRWR